MISLYINYFDRSHLLRSKYLKPIQVGKKNAKLNLHILGDDTGDNISEKNPFYCELTGQYWAWKNDLTSDYYGFMHYRRLLDFDINAKRVLNAAGVIHEEKFFEGFEEKYALTDERIKDYVTQYDVIVPFPFDVQDIGYPTVREHYKNALYHHYRDIKETESVVKKLFPDYSPYFQEMMDGANLYPTNIFIFKKEYFHQYSSWLFLILEEVEKNLDISVYSAQEARVFGYLAERLFTVFFLKLRHDEPNLRIGYLNRIFIQNTYPLPECPPLPETDRDIVSIAATTDEKYLPHLAALMNSVFTNANSEKFLDFIVLDGGIGDRNRVLLKTLEAKHPNVCISFIDMSNEFSDVKAHSYFNATTFYRLALPRILKNRSKLLFLDTDMVVTGDVTELYAVDLGGSLLGAVRDLIMRTFVIMGVEVLAEAGKGAAGKYLVDKIGLGDTGIDYFQAGTLLLDLEKIRQLALPERMISDLKRNTYWFLDQDVLNKFFKGKVLFLDNRWNSVYIDEKHFSYLTDKEQQIQNYTMKDPWIIHFAGWQKPWLNSLHPEAPTYWRYLRDTPWYETSLFDLISKNTASLSQLSFSSCLSEIKKVDGNTYSTCSLHSFLRSFLSFFWRKSPRFIKRMMRPAANWFNRKLHK